MAKRPRTLARGIGFRQSVDWMRAWGGKEIWEKTIEPLTPEERSILGNLKLTETYELDLPGKLYRSFATQTCGEDMDAARLVFEQFGIYMATDDIGRIIYPLQNPRLLARLLPQQWKMLFPGIEVEVESIDLSEKRVVNLVRGLGAFSYVSPVARGWMEQALKMAGATRASVEETEFNAGKIQSDELKYEISWE